MPLLSEDAYAVELCSYRYLMLVVTFAMSIIFTVKVTNAPPKNFNGAYYSAQYIYSPLVIGYVVSYYFFLYRNDPTIYDSQNLTIAVSIALGVFMVVYLSTKDFTGTIVLNYLYIAIAIMAFIIAITIIVQALRYTELFSANDDNTWGNFFIQLFTFIPCMIQDLFKFIGHQFKMTANPILILFLIEIIILIVIFYLPTIMQRTIGKDARILLSNAVDLSKIMKLSDSTPMILDNVSMNTENKLEDLNYVTKFRQNYSLSMWIYINKYDSTMNHKQPRNIFVYGNENMIGKPSVYIQSSHVYVGLSNLDVDNTTLPLDFDAQKWNQLVISYHYNQVDVFVNGELFKSMDLGSRIPTMSPDDMIVIGDDRGGINGSICNISYSKIPLTKMQISTSYNMLQMFNPPIIPGITNDASSSPSANIMNSSIISTMWKSVKDKFNSIFPQFTTALTAPKPATVANNTTPKFTGYSHQ